MRLRRVWSSVGCMTTPAAKQNSKPATQKPVVELTPEQLEQVTGGAPYEGTLF